MMGSSIVRITGCIIRSIPTYGRSQNRNKFLTSDIRSNFDKKDAQFLRTKKMLSECSVLGTRVQVEYWPMIIKRRGNNQEESSSQKITFSLKLNANTLFTI